jgi:DNA-binding NarL/FixJ family response regulator
LGLWEVSDAVASTSLSCDRLIVVMSVPDRRGHPRAVAVRAGVASRPDPPPMHWAILIGAWHAMAGHQVRRISSDLVVERCEPDLGWLLKSIRARRPCWLLIGQGLDDEKAYRMVRASRGIDRGLRIGLLASPDDRWGYLRWARRGCSMCLDSSASPERLDFALHAVVLHDLVVVDSIFGVKHSQAGLGEPLPRLTSRERDVLELVAGGLRNREIAAQLYLSENTVEAHLRSVFSKLNVRSRTQALRSAVQKGII